MTRKEAIRQAYCDTAPMMKRGFLAVAIFGFMLFTGMLQNLEGKLYPVIAGSDITYTTSYAKGAPYIEGQTLFYGEARKLRQCDFERIEWFLNDGGISRVNVEFYEMEKVRRPGDFRFGPWGIRLSKEELRQKTFAVVYHRCHPLWLTATHFYP